MAVRFKHVDLLDGLDGLDIQLLKSSLQLLLVGAARLVDLLDLSSDSAFAAATVRSAPPILSRADMPLGTRTTQLDSTNTDLPCQ